MLFAVKLRFEMLNFAIAKAKQFLETCRSFHP